MIDLGVVNERKVFYQQVSYTVAGLVTTSTYGVGLIATGCPNTRFVFEVVSEKSAEFHFMISNHFREVVFPNIEILAIIPGRLVPERVLPAGPPEHWRRTVPCVIVMWKHCREDRHNLI